MVRKIEAYLDDAGQMHLSVVDAHRADLQQWLKATEAVNEASAAALARIVVEDRDALFELVSMLEAVARDTGATDER